jgi:hypothetical protein
MLTLLRLLSPEAGDAALASERKRRPTGRMSTMSKLETPMTQAYAREIGGILLEEFQLVRRTEGAARRLIDGLVIRGDKVPRDGNGEVDLTGQDIVLIQTKANRLGMYLLGQALFSRDLVERFKPGSVETVALCSRDDEVLRPLAQKYGITVAVREPVTLGA